MNSSDDDATLPGLEAPARPAGDMEKATRATIVALNDAGLLNATHAMTCQLMIELARSVEAGRLAKRASAVAMAAAQLRDCFLSLPEPERGPGDDSDPFTRLANELREAALRNIAEHRAAE